MPKPRRGSLGTYYKHLEYVLRLKREKKAKAIEYLGGKCKRCEKVYPPCVYDFHHVNPKNKSMRGSYFLQWSWERIKEELNKCILLCANCHRMEHMHSAERARLSHLQGYHDGSTTQASRR